MYLVNPKTAEVVHTFPNDKALKLATGISGPTIWKKKGQAFNKQKPYKFTKGQVIGEYAVVLAYVHDGVKLVQADPNAEYIVTDGTLTYHKGTLDICKTMVQQIGIPTLTIQLWKQHQ